MGVLSFDSRRRLDEAAPVLDDLGRLAVNLEPCQRLAERSPVGERAPGSR